MFSSIFSTEIIFFLTVITFIASPLIERVSLRFQGESTAGQLDVEGTGRLAKWIIYWDFFLDNPSIFVYGNTKEINYNRASHNFFLQRIYKVGLLTVFILIFYAKIIRLALKRNKQLFYVFIPFLLTITMINTDSSGIYLYLFLPLIMFDNSNQKNFDRVRKHKFTRNKHY